jgi:putative mRNA 3-end processing factor
MPVPASYIRPMRPEDLICPIKTGLCVQPSGVHIDPMRRAERALITHGHSDHARPGHGAVMATAETLAIMAARYGDDFAGSTQAVAYGEVTDIGGGVTATFLPAGHVLGSAQILLEWRGFRAIVSGDYKRQTDPTCESFALARCHLFVTEATFGLPVFRHPDPMEEIGTLLDSVSLFPERAHLVGAYALGKAQRLMGLLRQAGYDQPIYMHGAMTRLTELYQSLGVDLGEVRQVRSEDRGKLGGAIVIAPVSALREIWSRRFPDPVNANASGWMRIRARARQCGVELPLVISDHADWNDLCRTILETEASEVWVTHGEEDALVHWCTMQGLRARPLRIVGYGEEGEEPAAPAEEQPAA